MAQIGRTLARSLGANEDLVEAVSGVLSAYAAWHFGFGWQAAMVMVLGWGLLSMSLIDAEHKLLPDSLVLPLLWLGLIVNSFGLFVSLNQALWGAVAGYLALWSVFDNPSRVATFVAYFLAGGVMLTVSVMIGLLVQDVLGHLAGVTR